MMAKENTTFALDIYRELAGSDDNLFFSPYSIKTALAMTYAGARGNTARQMADVLHFPDNVSLHPTVAKLESRLKAISEKGHIQLNVANALWPLGKYPFLTEFCDLLETYYHVTLTPLDYINKTEESRITINQWVEEKTNRKIENLIPPGILNPLTRLVLTNAIYFIGDWAAPFDPQLTEEAAFFLVKGDTASTQLMHQEQEFNYGKTGNLQIIELPYQDNDLSMIVILPDKPDGITKLNKEMKPEKLAKWLPVMKKRKVEVFFPKFKMGSNFVLNGPLNAMGMSDAFSAKKADFSGMDGLKWLYISKVLHKTFVAVNEEGTEAAAATAVIMKLRGQVFAQPPVFRADHPFIFLIRENETGSILFMGRVLNPADQGEA